MNYDHYVCFECRKQFKQNVFPSRETLAPPKRVGNSKVRGYTVWKKELTPHPCPQCSKEMELIGERFRAPKQSDVEGWEVAWRLHRAGFRFWERRGRMPTHHKDVPDFLAANQRHSEGEQLLDKWRSRT